MLQHNAKIYGVLHNVSVVKDDFLNFCNTSAQVDVVFASPPWGGPCYLNDNLYDINKITPSITEIIISSAKISKNLILYLPKTLNPIDIYTAVLETGLEFKKIEFQVYYIGKNVKAIGCMFGDIVRPDPEDLKHLYRLLPIGK